MTWREWQDAPWGRLRYALADANSSRHLTDHATVLDLGGGSGLEAARFATTTTPTSSAWNWP
ncbi:hypothetical protein [Actinokineospora terrae]|uniref:S-adenosylmethionine-dependent methyltransferase n=1 Tax=Actinokineospora terrae TaxID=155974 RepID=A0A1H9UJD8_9PSEU|nr:hypothetical protein [Actinokineospora terrae]SES09153.1 S-adenosylmethionine-dependent methyltransferase [Actinokineospora terrae]